MNDKKGKQMASIPFKNDIEFNETEQQPTHKNKGSLIPFFLSLTRSGSSLF